MARFYGTTTSRLGHHDLEVTAQSDQGDIVVSFARDGDIDQVEIRARLHGGGSGVCLYAGPVEYLVDQEGHQLLLQDIANKALLRHTEET